MLHNSGNLGQRNIAYSSNTHSRLLLTAIMALMFPIYAQKSYANQPTQDTTLTAAAQTSPGSSLTTKVKRIHPDKIPAVPKQPEPIPELPDPFKLGVPDPSKLWVPGSDMTDLFSNDDFFPVIRIEFQDPLSERQQRHLAENLEKFDDGTGGFKPDAEAIYSASVLALYHLRNQEHKFFDSRVPSFLIETLWGLVEAGLTISPVISDIEEAFTTYNLMGGLRPNLHMTRKIDRKQQGYAMVEASNTIRIPLFPYIPMFQRNGKRYREVNLPRLPPGFGKVKFDIDANLTDPKLDGIYLTVFKKTGNTFKWEVTFGVMINETAGLRDLDRGYGGWIPTDRLIAMNQTSIPRSRLSRMY